MSETAGSEPVQPSVEPPVEIPGAATGEQLRREALFDRGEVKDLLRRAVAAEGSLIREVPGRVASGPDKAGTWPVPPDGVGPASESERCTQGTGVLRLSMWSPARTWWIWAGRGAHSPIWAGNS